MEKDLKGSISQRHKWLSNIPYSTLVDEVPCTCQGEKAAGCVAVLPVSNPNEIIVWNNCLRTAYAALKRHLMAVPLPQQTIVDKFHRHVDSWFATHIEPRIANFTYCTSAWFNHLTRKQQINLLGKAFSTISNWDGVAKYYQPLIDNISDTKVYDIFCKREVQIVDNPQQHTYDGADLPKNRAIAATQEIDKYIQGPVTWFLEKHVADMPGFPVGKSWEELEQSLTQLYNQGYTHVAYGDGSGWDRTQSHELKYVDRIIYGYLARNKLIKHVDPELFYQRATARYRTLRVPHYTHPTIRLQATIDATLASGDTDTYILNTLRMIAVNTFILDQLHIEYKLWCKGDDFIIFLKNDIDLAPHYYKYWSKKNENLGINYGLGITLKFMKTGPINEFDFCSTGVIKHNDHFKLTRQPHRFNILSRYSIKAYYYSPHQLVQYYNDLIVGLKSWTNNMPYYHDLIDGLEIQKQKCIKHITDHNIKNRCTKTNPKKKKKRFETNYLDDITQDEYEKGFDYIYSQKLRNSKNTIPDFSVYDYLLTKNLDYISVKRNQQLLLTNYPYQYLDIIND